METKELIEKQISEVKKESAYLENELDRLEGLKKSIVDKKGMETWINFTFESSSGLTEEFAQFARDFKKYIKNIAKPDFEVVNFSRGHFECSGFFKNITNSKYVYFSTSDVRHFKNEWFNNILVRTAKHEKDYTGGANCSCNLNNLKESIIKLSK